ncbi:MAG: Do family serine endopeptidase [Peptococcaceae bacterium]|jgi:Do/DeqQ family serine protease|nr:Do family serine endopeptidase [Peptococcaceae bacterium]MDH7525419.1 Do family serine endopeptidase [Peptococcaceae bacterium]
MERLRVNKLLVVYTLLIFLGGVLFTGAVIAVKGYDVPWVAARPALAETQQPESAPSQDASAFFGADAIQKIVERAGPAVVKIETTAKSSGDGANPFFNDPFFRQFFGDSFRINPQPRIQQGLGSGFIISTDGYILTNNHVVEGADEVKVYLTSRPEPYDAKVVGSDAELDLAVLKIEAGSELPILKLGDSNKTKVGNWVIAIGNPYGLDHTVTVGVISAKGRPINIDGNEYKDLIQTDASINPGNSGGPLLNLDGEVVGINTAINAQAQGIGFAIPSSTVMQVLDQLLEKGKVVRPWLGIYMQPLTEDLAKYFGLNNTEGALVGAVQEGSPADKAGLKRGDIILEFNKTKIASPQDLQKAVSESKVGDKVVLLVHRNKATIYVTVTIGERK